MTAPTSFTRTDVVERIAKILADMLIDWSPTDGEYVHLFDDLGLDSLDGHDMVTRLEQEFALTSEPDDFARTLSVHTVIEAVCRKLDDVGRLLP